VTAVIAILVASLCLLVATGIVALWRLYIARQEPRKPRVPDYLCVDQNTPSQPPISAQDKADPIVAEYSEDPTPTPAGGRTDLRRRAM
jgi:hypothetical protein